MKLLFALFILAGLVVSCDFEDDEPEGTTKGPWLKVTSLVPADGSTLTETTVIEAEVEFNLNWDEAEYSSDKIDYLDQFKLKLVFIDNDDSHFSIDRYTYEIDKVDSLKQTFTFDVGWLKAQDDVYWQPPYTMLITLNYAAGKVMESREIVYQ